MAGNVQNSSDGYTGYCVKCKAKDRPIKDAKEVAMKGKGGTTRRAVTGKCEKCGTTMYRMLPKKD